MMHFDFQVGDLDSAVPEADALGATVAAHQPQENVRVLLDPAGHPFCLCRDDGWPAPAPQRRTSAITQLNPRNPAGTEP